MKTLLPIIGLIGLMACGCGKKSPQTAATPDPNIYSTTYSNELDVQLKGAIRAYYFAHSVYVDEEYAKLIVQGTDKVPQPDTNHLSFEVYTNWVVTNFWTLQQQGQEPPPPGKR